MTFALMPLLLALQCSQVPKHWDHALSTTGAGSYLRQIAALHDWEQTAADMAQLHQDLQAALASCAKQLLLPAVKVGTRCTICLLATADQTIMVSQFVSAGT